MSRPLDDLYSQRCAEKSIRYFRYNFSYTVVNKSLRRMAEIMRNEGVKISSFLIPQLKRITWKTWSIDLKGRNACGEWLRIQEFTVRVSLASISHWCRY